jgi:DNA-binding response OmpR family regulator
MDDDAAVKLKIIFGLSMQQANVLELIMKRQIASKDAIMTHLYGATPEGGPITGKKAIDVVVHHVRKRLAHHDVKITTVYGVGFMIRPEGKKIINDLLSATS